MTTQNGLVPQPPPPHRQRFQGTRSEKQKSAYRIFGRIESARDRSCRLPSACGTQGDILERLAVSAQCPFVVDARVDQVRLLFEDRLESNTSAICSNGRMKSGVAGRGIPCDPDIPGPGDRCKKQNRRKCITARQWNCSRHFGAGASYK